MAVTIKESGDGLKNLMEAIAFLKNNRVLIGIPQAGSGSHGSLTNVELAFIQSNGSPVNRIPPRPFLEPALADGGVQASISEKMKMAVQAAIEGDTGKAMGELDEAGFYGENAVKDYFTGGHFAPNAGITIHGGWMRNRVSGKPVYVKGKKSSAPLIDTGSLRSSITHVIEGK